MTYDKQEAFERWVVGKLVMINYSSDKRWWNGFITINKKEYCRKMGCDKHVAINNSSDKH